MTLPAPIAISDIWPPPTIDDVRSLNLGFIAVDQNPVTDWHSGAVLRTMFELESYVLQDLVANLLPGIFANGYPDAGGDSQTETAHGWYAIDRAPPTFARQTITLACDGSHGPYPIAAGLLYSATDSSVYTGLAGGTLPTGSTLTFDVAATSPGAARGLVNALVQQLAGVTVQSAAIKVIGGVGQFGSDEETDAALFAQTDARFEDLDAPLTDEDLQDRVETWALAAGTSATRTRIDADPAVPGGILLTLANGTGGITSGEVTTVQAYIDARAFDYITAQTATNASVTAGGTVLYPASWTSDQLTAAKAAADAAWAVAFSINQIGGLVELMTLNKVVMDTGVVDFVNKTLNGSPVDLVLASAEVPVAAGSLGAELTWSPY